MLAWERCAASCGREVPRRVQSRANRCGVYHVVAALVGLLALLPGVEFVGAHAANRSAVLAFARSRFDAAWRK